MSTLIALNNVLGNDHNTGALDLRANHCVYLHSPTLAHYKVLGPAGSRSCIARIAVNSGYGSILTHQHSGHVLDYIPCGGVTLRTLSFELRNANNEVVDMRGGHVSFSIIFLFPLLCKTITKVKCQLHYNLYREKKQKTQNLLLNQVQKRLQKLKSNPRS